MRSLDSVPAMRGSGFAPPVPQVPPRLSAAVLWLRADAIQGVANAGAVTTWPDRSATAAVFVQATTANKPVWNASDITYFGGQPSITSTASKFLESVGNVVQAQPFTLYAIAATTSVSTYQVVMSNSGDSFEFGFKTTAYYAYAPTNTWGVATGGAAHLICYEASGASSAMYVDSSTVAKTLATGTGNTTGAFAGQAVVGFKTGTIGLIGNLAEIILYPGLDSAAQRADVFVYAANHYHLAVAAADGDPDWRLALLYVPPATDVGPALTGWPYPTVTPVSYEADYWGGI
jgi:hypothetical protein